MREMECLFCKSKENSFDHIEHVIPESLGNTKFVLKNIVCDKCNSYFSELEGYFIHHHPSSQARLHAIHKTKKGKPPSQILQAGRAKRTLDGSLQFTQGRVRGRESEQLTITFQEDEFSIEATYFLPDADATKLSRVLSKIALETLCLFRNDLLSAASFESLRRYARFGDTIDFIPFLWRYQNERNTDLLLGEITNKELAVFYYAVIFVPGCVYFVPCHHFNESGVFDDLADFYTLNKVTSPGIIRRDPIKLKLSSSSQAAPSGNST